MTLTATICFLSCSDALKERHLKGYAATLQAHAVKVSSFVQLTPFLDPNKPPLIVVDFSSPLNRKQLSALRGFPVISFMPDKGIDSLNLSHLTEHAAVCLSSDKNLLRSPFLRICLIHLIHNRPEPDFSAIFHWGSAELALSNAKARQATQLYLDTCKLSSRLQANIDDFRNYIDKLVTTHSLKNHSLMSDALSLAQVATIRFAEEKDPQWLKELKAIHQLGSPFKMLHFSASKPEFTLAGMDSLMEQAKRLGQESKHREFMILNPQQMLKNRAKTCQNRHKK